MPEPLTASDKRTLLRLARLALTAAVQQTELERPELANLSPALRQPAASFVTLTCAGELRGCMGGLQAEQPLAYDVQEHTALTALYDVRFGPVAPGELEDIEIEISVLSPPQPLSYRDADELLRLLRPGVDGLILSGDGRHATFLPQVWERVPDREAFLDLLCRKMDLPDDAWRSGALAASTYQVEKFTEREFGRG